MVLGLYQKVLTASNNIIVMFSADARLRISRCVYSSRHVVSLLRVRVLDRALMLMSPQAGIGRTGKVWGYQNFDVEPDVIASAKVSAMKKIKPQ